MNKIYKISISHKEIVVFLNGGKIRIYKSTPERIQRLSRHPKYKATTSQDVGLSFSAYIK